MLASIVSNYKNIAIKLLLLLICFLFSQFVSVGISYSYSDAGDGNGGYGDTSTGNTSQSGTGDYDAGYGNTSSGHSAPGSSVDYDAGYGNTSSGHSAPGSSVDYDAGYSSSGGTSQSTSGNTSTGNTSQNTTSGGTSSSNPQNTPDTSDNHNDNTYTSSGYPYTGALKIGDKVEAISLINVYATPDSRSYSKGSQTDGSVGVIIEGPSRNLQTGAPGMYRVDYESGFDGWSTEVSFRLVASQTPATIVTDPVPTPSNTACSYNIFKVGMEVETTANLRVRSNPSLTATFLGVQRKGSKGVIIDGPVIADGYYWYKTDYASGHDGWNVSCWLLHKTNYIPPSIPTPICTADAKQCSDGSFVGRSGPNCEFICPTITSYSLTDVSYVTKVSYGNYGLYNGIDIYTIVLKNGTSYKVSIYNRGEFSNAETKLRDTGYIGDIKELMALADKAFTSNGTVLGASTNIYDEIGNTLSRISLLLKELTK